MINNISPKQIMKIIENKIIEIILNNYNNSNN